MVDPEGMSVKGINYLLQKRRSQNTRSQLVDNPKGFSQRNHCQNKKRCRDQILVFLERRVNLQILRNTPSLH